MIGDSRFGYYVRNCKYNFTRLKLKMNLYTRFRKRKIKEFIKKTIPHNTVPSILQLPITYKCNFDCAMCGMRSLVGNTDFSVEDLKSIISDPLYEKIASVGVNGGEPFLRKDLIECIKVLLTLPSINNFFFISNGYFTEKILASLKEITALCNERNVKVNISISVDGIDDMQDTMRGHKNAFVHADETCRRIIAEPGVYCDYLNVISTITKVNIGRIYEVEKWSEELGIDVAYNVATIHERIANDYKYEDFSVFTDEEARHLAMEFFYGLFRKDLSERYFAIYYFIRTGKRIAYCDYQHGALTVAPNGNIAYCATHSKELGSAIGGKTSEVYNANIDYQNKLIDTFCEGCSHYMYSLTAKGLKLYNKEVLKLIP